MTLLLQILMADQLPSGNKAMYVFLEMIALAFVFGAVEALLNDKPWYVWIVCLVLSILFFLAGIKWGTSMGFVIVAVLAIAIIGYGAYRYFHRNESITTTVPTESSPPTPAPVYMEFTHTALRVDPDAKTTFVANQPAVVAVSYQNKTEFGTARGAFLGLTLQFIPPGKALTIREEDKFKQFRNAWVPHAVQEHGEDVGAGETRVIDLPTTMELPKQLVDGLMREEVYMYFFGIIKWADDTGIWETQSCSHLLVKRSDLETGSAIWRQCESGSEHNFIRHAFVAAPQ